MTNHERSEVTAQDILDILFKNARMVQTVDQGFVLGIPQPHEEKRYEKAIDALLSRARQEVRREALKEVDELWQKLRIELVMRKEYSNQP